MVVVVVPIFPHTCHMLAAFYEGWRDAQVKNERSRFVGLDFWSYPDADDDDDDALIPFALHPRSQSEDRNRSGRGHKYTLLRCYAGLFDCFQ